MDNKALEGLVGREVAGYRIVRMLGKGGMSAVFRARQVTLDRDVALKVLFPQLMEDAGGVERFQREARVIARLQHDNVVSVYDLGNLPDGLRYIAMELCEGGSLADRARGGRVEFDEALRMIREAARGLHAAAEKGVIHRDVKPDNLLLTSSGRVKVADFGIAGVGTQGQRVTATSTVMGTPAYMPPEQFSGLRECDHRSDLYSLGCALYELLTGAPPFPGPQAVNYMAQHMFEAPPDLRVARPDAPADVAAIVARLLAKDPEARFQSGPDLVAAIEAALSPPPAPAPDVAKPGKSAPPRTSKGSTVRVKPEPPREESKKPPERSSVAFGIEVGFSTVRIATSHEGKAEVIRNGERTDATPAAVWIDRKGALVVGRRAMDRADDDEDNAARDLLAQLGSGARRAFRRSGKSALPEELLGEVLRALAGDARHRTGVPPREATIALPAGCELAQVRAATHAAQLAGIERASFVRAPVAAALAGGLLEAASGTRWLVYDLGRSRFEASVVEARDGALHVLGFDVDAQVGGRAMDAAIVDELLVPPLLRESPKLSSFERASARWRHAFFRLDHHAEEAKIRLTRDAATDVTVDDVCKDEGGDAVRLEHDLSRGEVERVVGPLIERSVRACRRALDASRLRATDLERVLLVGGPTLMPIVREALADPWRGIKARLDTSSDPTSLTVRGAAKLAAWLLARRDAAPPIAPRAPPTEVAPAPEGSAAIERLRAVLARHGRDATLSPARLSELLIQEGGGRLFWEEEALLAAQEEKVPQAIAKGLGADGREPLIARLIERQGLCRRTAVWAIEAWSAAV